MPESIGANSNNLESTVVDTILSVKDMAVSFEKRAVVQELNFSLPVCSCLAIIGPNGSGKTVLLKALLGLLPAEGFVLWKPGTRLGYVPQAISGDSRLPLRARELLQAKARIQRLSTREVDATVQWVGIENLLDKPLGTLSSGQLQQLLIVFALLGTPTALLVDEPTSSLDALAEGHIYKLLQRARHERGMTVLLVSHDLTLVRGMATHVLCLGEGKGSFGAAGQMLVPEVFERMYGQPVEFHSHSFHSNALDARDRSSQR